MKLSRWIISFGGLIIGILSHPGSSVGQVTARSSVDSSGVQGDEDSSSASLSANGRLVAFDSDATNLVDNDTFVLTDVFVHDRDTGITELVSINSDGIQANHLSFDPVISADGNAVAFVSSATNLVSDDLNETWDIFVHDRTARITERVSVSSSGVEADRESAHPSISADGRFVVFESQATNLVPNDRNQRSDIFVRDRLTGFTERVSIGNSGAEANSSSYFPSISADGLTVAFQSAASNLVADDKNNSDDVFVYDRATKMTERVSLSSAGAEADASSSDGAISANGSVVVFVSKARNLIPADTNRADDTFVHDRATGTTERVSVDTFGNESDGPSDEPSISADGAIIVFSADATNLVENDTNGVDDIFVHDRKTGVTIRVSVDSAGAQGKGASLGPSVSSDGSSVGFDSRAYNLVSDDTNGVDDVFVHDLCSADATWSNYGDGFPGRFGIPSITSLTDPVLGKRQTIHCDSSSGDYSVALVLIGWEDAFIPSDKGGVLLLIPEISILVPLGPDGIWISALLPGEETLCGTEVFLQAVELDPAAQAGLSFTPGLKLVLGY